MHKTGLVSVSFRPLSPEEILQGMVKAGLKYIEWGSDVHAPYADEARLDELVGLMKKYDITCCSYGTYFRMGITPMEELRGYLKAAKKLGTNIARIWAGKARVDEQTPEWRQELIGMARQAAKIAEEEGVIICTECHKGTVTETKEYALELMEAVNSPYFRTYWQPNGVTVEDNVEYIRLLKPYIDHLHVYNWKDGVKLPLADAIDAWKSYAKELDDKEHFLLLEFMPDGLITTLPAEADALRQIVAD